MTTLYPLTHKLRLGATLLLLCGLSVVGFSQTFTGDQTFATQEDVDAFVDGSGMKYDQVNGSLTLNPTEVFTDLSNFSEISSITQDLVFRNYGNNQTITDPLSAFASLTSAGNFRVLDRNGGITDLTSDTLATITGSLEIGNSPNLDNIILTDLLSVGGSFIIRNNLNLSVVNTPALVQIIEDFRFNDNDAVTNFDGFPEIESIGGGIYIRNNQALTQISGLGITGSPSNGRALYTVDDLVFENNFNLENFTGLQATVTDRFVLAENENLKTVSTTVYLGSASGSSIQTPIMSEITVRDNPDLESIALIFDRNPIIRVQDYNLVDNVLLDGTGGQRVKVLGSITVDNNDRITRLPNFEQTTSLTGSLTIQNNQLINLAPVSANTRIGNLTQVGGNVNIINNATLSNLTGLGSLATVGGTFTLSTNGSVTTLDALISLVTIDTALFITNNAQLGDCCQLPCQVTVNGQQFDGLNPAVTVSGNTGDCQDKQAVVNACADEPGKECLAAAAPVEFIAFTGQLNGNYVELNWATATETENDYFQVERSNDGVNFVALGQVAGAGDSQQELDYSYLDYDFQAGANYYRLRQVDYDGTQDFSDVIVVDAGGAATALGIYPNPASSGNVNVALDNGWNKERLTLDVFSASGQHVYQLTSINGAKFELPADRLSPGMYAVRVTDGARTLTERLVIR